MGNPPCVDDVSSRKHKKTVTSPCHDCLAKTVTWDRCRTWLLQCPPRSAMFNVRCIGGSVGTPRGKPLAGGCLISHCTENYHGFIPNYNLQFGLAHFKWFIHCCFVNSSGRCSSCAAPRIQPVAVLVLIHSPHPSIEAVLDAAQIAGLNILRVMNEHTATALAYGIYRSNDFDPEKPMTVALLGEAWHGIVAGIEVFQKPQTSYPKRVPGWRCTTPLISDMDWIVPNLSLSITIYHYVSWHFWN